MVPRHSRLLIVFKKYVLSKKNVTKGSLPHTSSLNTFQVNQRAKYNDLTPYKRFIQNCK